ncbi:hypothetical protein NUU61_005863 [Penicillium alfredii]|uniref:Uncharacterized protein n=1 Tax=Penicillium alfredii TaxID=1506179 RepID=A0A9W9FA80_9EURO|nr:hypothetical protein NUU61_005863 [Penicillium alfredii]
MSALPIIPKQNSGPRQRRALGGEEAAPGGLPPSFAKSDSPVHCWETAEGRGGPAASAPGSGGCERKWVGGHVTRVPEENDQVPRVSGTCQREREREAHFVWGEKNRARTTPIVKPFPTSTFWAPERLSARHPPKWGRRVCVEANRTVRSGPPGGPLAGAGVVRGAGGRDPRGGGCGRVGAGLAGRSRDGTTAAPPGEPFPPVGWAPRAAAGGGPPGPGTAARGGQLAGGGTWTAGPAGDGDRVRES